MIAIPVKTNQENPAVSTLFGRSKWFAFIDGENISIERNEDANAKSIIEKMKTKGVDTVIFNHMGGNPFVMLQQEGIECFFSGKERIVLDAVLEKHANKELIKVDSSNMTEYIGESSAHAHGHEHHDHHHDHHHH